MISSLNEITIEEVKANDKYSATIFNHIKAAVSQNFYRIDIFWEIITSHFMILTNSKNPNSRENGCETLSSFIILGFQYLSKYHNVKAGEKASKNSLLPTLAK
jgi:hypothetical protein